MAALSTIGRNSEEFSPCAGYSVVQSSICANSEPGPTQFPIDHHVKQQFERNGMLIFSAFVHIPVFSCLHSEVAMLHVPTLEPLAELGKSSNSNGFRPA